MARITQGRLWMAAAMAVVMAGSVPSDARAGRLDAADPSAGGQRSAFSSGPRFSMPRFTRKLRRARPVERSISQERRQKRRQGGSAPAIQISAPAYYDYVADPVVPVDFTPLLDKPQLAAFAPGTGDAPFDEALKGLNGFELAAEKPIAEALLAFYAEHPRFVWVDEWGPNARTQEALRVLNEADAFGLAAQDYAVAMPAMLPSAGGQGARLDELIRFEMALSARALRYLRDARNGRIDPNRLSGYHDFTVRPFDGRAELARLVRAKNMRAALEGAHPRMPEFAALRAELARLRGGVEASEPVDGDLLLKPGEASPELPKVLRLVARELAASDRADLGTAVEKLAQSEVYEEDLVPAVKAVQELKGLRPDGILGPRTVQALVGVSHAERVEKVEIALEQLRWLPRDLGATRVFINQPAFEASFIEDGAEKLSMRVVIGTPANQTSFFHDEIEQVDYNPYWGVPQSILINEMLPRLRRDPGYLDRAGYEVSDSKGRKISSSAVNWWSYSPNSPVSVRQTPSEANALGELKILFPNKHAIYMHDTPAKDLFRRDVRAFSHGCVRLHDPRGMAAAVLGATVEHVEEKLAQGHSTEKVTRRIPVYVAYFTAWPDASGAVEYFADVYERDKHLEGAMERAAEVRAAGS